MSFIQEQIQKIVNFIIRPNRQTYQQTQLGNNVFSIASNVYNRHDISIPYYIHSDKLGSKNHKMIIKASFFEKARKRLPEKERICVLNLHGNIGNKLSCFSNIETILKLGLEACCFDFLGCGNSDGQYITLGNQEKFQIQAVISKIHSQFKISKFILWGRSMGASSAVLYCSHFKCKYTIGLILDSPYCSMEKMFRHVASQRLCYVPEFLFNKLSSQIDEKIVDQIGYSVKQIDVSKGINRMKIPVFVFYGLEDKVVPLSQIQKLFLGMNTNKKLQMIQDQGHNERRQEEQQEHALKWVLDFQK